MARGYGVMFWGRGGEPPKEHGGFRNLPRLLRTAFGMVWEADRRRASEAFALQLVLGVATGIQLLITRNLIAAVLAPNVARDPSPLITQLGLMVAVETTSQFVGLYQRQQQQVLMEQIQRRAGLRVVDVASQVDMAQFDTPEFQDRLQRAQQAIDGVLLRNHVRRAAEQLRGGLRGHRPDAGDATAPQRLQVVLQHRYQVAHRR